MDSARRERRVIQIRDPLALDQAILIVMGMAFFWQILRIRNITELFSMGSASFVTLMFAMLATMIAVICFPTSFERWVSRERSMFFIALLASTVLFFHWFGRSRGWWDDSSLPACLIGASVGVVDSLLMVSWYTCFSHLRISDDRFMMILLLLSSVASFFIAAIMFSISPFPALMPILVPLCCGFCYRLCMAGREGYEPTFRHVSTLPERIFRSFSNIGSPPSGLLLIVLVILCFLSNIVLSMIDRSLFSDYVLWLKYCLTILVAIIIFGALLRSRDELKTLFIVWLLLMSIFIIGISFIGSGGSMLLSIGSSVVTTCRTCAELLICFLLVRDLFDCTAAYRNLGLLFVIPEIVAMLIGYWILPVCFDLVGTTASHCYPVVSIAIGAVSIVSLIAILSVMVIEGYSREKMPDWGDPSQMVSRAGREGVSCCGGGDASSAEEVRCENARKVLPDSCIGTGASGAKDSWTRTEVPTEALEHIAALYNLTAREVQIMLYAFRGYSLQHVAELDTVSINTVKSHWKNLYHKLDIHSRQELIDLIETGL